MKRIRLGVTLLVLALATGFSLVTVPNSSAGAAWPKCTCKFPNTNEYGIKDEKSGCEVTDCWVSLDEDV